MKSDRRSVIKSTVLGAACMALSAVSASVLAQASPGPGPGAGPGRGGGFASDPRAESRTYHFADANQDMPYCMYKSSRVSKDTAAPLVVALHGMGAPPSIMCNKDAIDQAEEGGYIYVAPMGYSTTGWYGSPVISMGPGRGPGAGPGGPGRGPGAGPGAMPGAGPGAGPGPGAPAPAASPAAAVPAGPSNQEIEKWSEQDVMNVLGMMREEFNVDPKRIYLTGHSMGGAGTYFLGAKHADIWAAVAPVAPASFMMNNNRAEILGKIKAAGVPIFLTSGDADEAVPIANTRMWHDTITELGLTNEYVEQPGITHGPIITTSQKDVFAFFAKHKKK